jgi:hypothetical protein
MPAKYICPAKLAVLFNLGEAFLVEFKPLVIGL